ADEDTPSGWADNVGEKALGCRCQLRSSEPILEELIERDGKPGKPGCEENALLVVDPTQFDMLTSDPLNLGSVIAVRLPHRFLTHIPGPEVSHEEFCGHENLDRLTVRDRAERKTVSVEQVPRLRVWEGDCRCHGSFSGR